jgi:hypothetical protein
MVFLLYKLYKSRDPFTKIIIEDFPSIGSRENALNLFNLVYGFIFTFCVFIIMVDLFNLNSYFAIIYNGESVNIKFLSPVKWLLALLLKTVLTYITYRSHGSVSFRFIISVFSLLLLIGIPIIYSSEFLTVYLKNGIISLSTLLIVGISYIWDLNFIPLPMDGINKSSWKPNWDKYTLKMVGNPGNNQPDPLDSVPGTDPEGKKWDRPANYTTRDDTASRIDLTRLTLYQHEVWVRSKLGCNRGIAKLNEHEKGIAWPSPYQLFHNTFKANIPGSVEEKIIATRYANYWETKGTLEGSDWNPRKRVEIQREIKQMSAGRCQWSQRVNEANIKHMLQTLDGTIPWDRSRYDYRDDLRKKVEVLKVDGRLMEIRNQEIQNIPNNNNNNNNNGT